MNNESKEMVKIVVDSLSEKKADEVKVIDISEISVLADYFVIAGGNNANHLQSMADECDLKLSQAGFECKNVEGYENGYWILMDFGDVIVHLFDKENRSLYNLERLWRDGKEVDINNLK